MTKREIVEQEADKILNASDFGMCVGAIEDSNTLYMFIKGDETVIDALAYQVLKYSSQQSDRPFIRSLLNLLTVAVAEGDVSESELVALGETSDMDTKEKIRILFNKIKKEINDGRE